MKGRKRKHGIILTKWRKNKKYRKLSNQEVFCTDDVMDNLMDLIEGEAITKFSKLSEYISIFDDLVYPVLIKQSKNNSFHFVITDTNDHPNIREFNLLNSPNGGSISHFYQSEDGWKVEKNFDLASHNTLYIQKELDNMRVSLAYASGGLDKSTIRINLKEGDFSTGFVRKNVDITMYANIPLEDLEIDFMKKIVGGFSNSLFTIRSSTLPFYDVISKYVTSFDVSIEQNKDSLDFSFFKEKGFKLSAKINTPNYKVAFESERISSLNTLKKFYASFLANNLEIID